MILLILRSHTEYINFLESSPVQSISPCIVVSPFLFLMVAAGMSNVSINSSGISFKLVFVVDSGAMSEWFRVKGRNESLLLQLPFCHGLNRVI